MLPSSNENHDENSRPFENPAKSEGREHFFDVTDRKIFDTHVHREYLSYKILLDINLEERRGNLRRLLENDENSLTDEHLSKIDTMSSRVQNLKDQALRIRNQTELDRQELSKTKKTQLERSKDDTLRFNQYKYHQKAIVEDWDQLKKIKEIQNREEICAEKFWDFKRSEIIRNLLEKEKKIKEKKRQVRNELMEQIENREKQKQILKQEEIENQMKDIESAKIVDQKLAADAIAFQRNKIAKAKDYHMLLDKQIKNKKSITDRHKSEEDSFESLMMDENLQHLKNSEFKSNLNILDNRKSMINFIHYQNCLKKEKQEEDIKINELVTKKQKELHKHRLEIEREKVKKFHKLIVDIKNAQKFQLAEAQEKKLILKNENIEDRIFANKVFQEDLRNDKIKSEKERLKREIHFNSFKQQLNFNENLENIRKAEHARERNSMIETENRYMARLNEIRSKDQILFEHPWRVR